MSSIKYRQAAPVKQTSALSGSALTHKEMDDNFFALHVTEGVAAAEQAIVLDSSSNLNSGINDFTIDNDLTVLNNATVTGTLNATTLQQGGSTLISSGTWTPTLTGSGGAVGAYGSRSGEYYKIGNLVYVSCTLVITTLGTLTGSLEIGGLPATVNSASSNDTAVSLQVTLVGYTPTTGNTAAFKDFNTSVYLQKTRSGNSPVAILASDIGDATTFRFGGVYRST